jgi:hypothetical protein
LENQPNMGSRNIQYLPHAGKPAAQGGPAGWGEGPGSGDNRRDSANLVDIVPILEKNSSFKFFLANNQ